MASSREETLAAIHRNRPAPVELPAIEHAWTTYADRRRHFIEVLELVGGQTIVAHDHADANEQLRLLPHVATAQKVVSLVPGVGAANVDLMKLKSPHDAEDVDVAILPGHFAVAENAAVWVTDDKVPLRVIYFLCQHLVLVVPGNEMVDHMHAAYERLQNWAAPHFGAFISGPSKTADIEQSLVIGAHGPRSLTVCLVGE